MPNVVFWRPVPMTTSKPCCDTDAPMTLKMSAWLDDVGRPTHHVMRSQMIAPMSAATTRSCVTTFASTMPDPTVFATASPDSAPRRLSTAAMRIACAGVRTRVATTVAMALAASWKPLTYSNARPRTTTAMTRMRPLSIFRALAVLDLDGLDDVGDVLAAVDRDLDALEEVLPFHELDRVALRAEELADGLAEDVVALVLERVQLDPVLLQILEPFQALHHQDELVGRGHEDLRLPHRGRAHAVDLVDEDELRHVVREIGHVVEPRGEAEDVLAVERRHEGPVQLADDL